MNDIANERYTEYMNDIANERYSEFLHIYIYVYSTFSHFQMPAISSFFGQMG